MSPSLNLQVILIENLIYVWIGSPVQGVHLSSLLVLLSLISLSALEDYQRVEWWRYLEKRHLGRLHLRFMLSRKLKRMEVIVLILTRKMLLTLYLRKPLVLTPKGS
uniref:RECA3 n=1 Tax=Arundo donax TaxID=35708 RepID=A0A0A9D065_ARUDO